jgi:hypothetical protein
MGKNPKSSARSAGIESKEDSMCDHGDGFDGLDWQDIALAGALAEELSEEERERELIRKELTENDDGVNEGNED